MEEISKVQGVKKVLVVQNDSCKGALPGTGHHQCCHLFDDIYSHLVLFSRGAHATHLGHTKAVQLHPYMCRCICLWKGNTKTTSTVCLSVSVCVNKQIRILVSCENSLLNCVVCAEPAAKSGCKIGCGSNLRYY